MSEESPEINPQPQSRERPRVRLVPSADRPLQPREHLIGPRSEGTSRISIEGGVFLDATRWLQTGGDYEHAGVFIGREIRETNGQIRLEATQFVPETQDLGTRTEVNVNHALTEARELIARNSRGERVVGWIHSHPGFRPAPSPQDEHAMWTMNMGRGGLLLADEFFTMIVDHKNNEVGVFRRRGDAPPTNEGGFVLTGENPEVVSLSSVMQVTPYDRLGSPERSSVSQPEPRPATQGTPAKITKEQIEAKRKGIAKVHFPWWKKKLLFPVKNFLNRLSS